MSEQQLLKIRYEDALGHWREQEKTALELLQITGELRFDRSVELLLFRRDIYDSRPSELIRDHKLSTLYADKPVTVENTLTIAHAIAHLRDLAPSKLDIGKLAIEWRQQAENYNDVDEFIGDKLQGHLGEDKRHLVPKDVVLYGFGRIGRLVTRRLITQTGGGEQLRLRAIVLRPKLDDRGKELEKRASLLRNDSVHGEFPGVVEVSESTSELIINGKRVRIIFAKHPTDIDYTEYGINDAIVIDNTGVWRDRDGLSLHMRPGVSQVMLTAPSPDIPNIVHGVNNKELDFEQDTIFCAASCTTNAIVPMLQILKDEYGIERGHLETIHSYTNDQNLLDNFHKKPRRGRGAPVNMVLTSTGAAKAVAKVIPELGGKLTGNAVRVPTPNVSLAILNLKLEKGTTVAELNETVRQAGLHGKLVEQIRYSDNEDYVSTDAIGMTSTSVFDAPSTIVADDGHHVTLYLWYDNEFGYSCQVVRLAKYVAQVRRLRYY